MTTAKATPMAKRTLFMCLIVAASLLLAACGNGPSPDTGTTCVFGVSTFGNCTFGP